MLAIQATLTLLLFDLAVNQVQGHGYMTKPPARGVVANDPNKMSNFCGGFYTQHNVNGGKCGVCGDAWRPRPYAPNDIPPNEAGGRWAPIDRIPTEIYNQGQVIDVEVFVSASHKGFFIFRVCDVGDAERRVTQECLNQNVLTIAGTNGETRYYGESGEKTNGIDDAKTYKIPLQLPKDFWGSFVVLQWWYKTGNSEGTDPDTGEKCLGCGKQETFVNCADIQVNPTGHVAARPYPIVQANPPTMTTRATRATRAPTTKTTTPAPAPVVNNAGVGLTNEDLDKMVDDISHGGWKISLDDVNGDFLCNCEYEYNSYCRDMCGNCQYNPGNLCHRSLKLHFTLQCNYCEYKEAP